MEAKKRPRKSIETAKRSNIGMRLPISLKIRSDRRFFFVCYNDWPFTFRSIKLLCMCVCTLCCFAGIVVVGVRWKCLASSYAVGVREYHLFGISCIFFRTTVFDVAAANKYSSIFLGTGQLGVLRTVFWLLFVCVCAIYRSWEFFVYHVPRESSPFQVKFGCVEFRKCWLSVNDSTRIR